MMQKVRQEIILNALHEKGSVRISDLAEQFQVSAITVRRDLEELADQGLLTKVYGGAVMPQRYRLGRAQADLSHNYREKTRIASAAAALVRDGETILLDIGTTTLEIAKNLRSLRQLTVLTNSVPILTEMAGSDAAVYSLGGFMRHSEMALCGSLALYSISQFCVDKAFIGCGGVTIQNGITDYSADSAELHAAIAQRAKQTYLVTDSSKFGRDAFAVVGQIASVHGIITDSGLPAEYADAIRGRGVELIVVDA